MEKCPLLLFKKSNKNAIKCNKEEKWKIEITTYGLEPGLWIAQKQHQLKG